jgi:hypothetical protein
MTVVCPSAGEGGKRQASHPELGHVSSSAGDEMLVKGRMMGLYLTVFVHRDAKHLVWGVSLSFSFFLFFFFLVLQFPLENVVC